MATSFIATHLRPERQVTVSRAACFGSFNRYDGPDRERLEVMEWHPEADTNGAYASSGYSLHNAKECFEFVNSFGFWKDIFRRTSMNGVAANIRELPADQIITGFMAARNHNFSNYGHLLGRPDLPSGITDLEASRLYFVGYAAGASVGALGFNWSEPQNGEGGVCRLFREDDAYGLYLLAYGTKEECSGAFHQNPLFSSGANTNGYLRDSHASVYQRLLRDKGYSPTQINACRSLADWLRIHLKSQVMLDSGKLGRLTVGQFIDRHEQRGGDVSSYFNMFEELKDLYS